LQSLPLPHHPQIHLPSNLGLACADSAHTCLQAWMNAADTALHAAKHRGRNRLAGEHLPLILDIPR
jgi:GGDEF domain-containing protein